MPAIPGHASPRQSLPKQSVPRRPLHDPPGLACPFLTVPDLPSPTGPYPDYPRGSTPVRAQPGLPDRSKPYPIQPRLAAPAMSHRASTHPAVPCRPFGATPRLPCHSRPHLASTRLSSPAMPAHWGLACPSPRRIYAEATMSLTSCMAVRARRMVALRGASWAMNSRSANTLCASFRRCSAAALTCANLSTCCTTTGNGS